MKQYKPGQFGTRRHEGEVMAVVIQRLIDEGMESVLRVSDLDANGCVELDGSAYGVGVLHAK